MVTQDIIQWDYVEYTQMYIREHVFIFPRTCYIPFGFCSVGRTELNQNSFEDADEISIVHV